MNKIAIILIFGCLLSGDLQKKIYKYNKPVAPARWEKSQVSVDDVNELIRNHQPNAKRFIVCFMINCQSYIHDNNIDPKPILMELKQTAITSKNRSILRIIKNYGY